MGNIILSARAIIGGAEQLLYLRSARESYYHIEGKK